MKSLTAVFALGLVLFQLGCDSPVMEPETLSSPSQAQFSTQPIREFAFSDYVPLIPGLYGVKTYATDDDGLVTSQIVGTESLPYTPPLTGIKMTLGDYSSVFAIREKKVWWLRNADYVLSMSQGAYSAYPESAIIGRLHDGMILDMTGGQRLWQVNASDPSDWQEVNTGYGDSYVTLIQVQDVRLPDRHVLDHWPDHQDDRDDFDFKWQTYKNAIFMWALEPNRPDLEFKLDFGGLDEILGIRLPTAEDTNGWAIDGFLIWGKNVGILMQGDIGLDTGEVEVDFYLVSQAPWPTG